MKECIVRNIMAMAWSIFLALALCSTAPTGSIGAGPDLAVSGRTTLAQQPVSTVNQVANPPSPSLIGTAITFTANASGGSGAYQYRFWVRNPAGTWSSTPYSGNSSWTWDTTGLAAGSYSIQVWARNAGSTAPYETYKGMRYTILNPPVKAVTLVSVPPSPVTVGTTKITFTANASGGSGAYQYRFWVRNPAGAWSSSQPYSGNSSWAWDTTGLAAGTYSIQVWAKNKGSTAAYEAYKSMGYVINPPPVTGLTVTADKNSPQAPGTSITFTGHASGGTGSYQYRFWVRSPAGTWSSQPYSSDPSWTWDTTGLVDGTYSVQVWARSEGSSANYEVAKGMSYSLNGPTSGKWVLGYYVGYQTGLLPPDKIDWSGLTHIVMSPLKAHAQYDSNGNIIPGSADGSLETHFYVDETNGPILAKDIAAKAHANGVKAILMLGGSDNGEAIHDAVRDHRATFIANLVNVMNDLGYDGIDLNWENHVDWDLFVAFAKELRIALPRPIILTLPGGLINSNFPSVEPKTVEVVKYMDQFNLMSYVGIWTGEGWWSWHNSALKGCKPNTPISIEDSFSRYVAAGIPKEKLGMGIGFFASGYTNGITAPNQSTEGSSIVGGDNADSLAKFYADDYSENYKKWDATAEGSYLSFPQGFSDSFGCRYVSFDDEQSILAKGKFTRDNGYGGAIIWTINQGLVSSHTNPYFLTQALRKAFIDPSYNPDIEISVSPKSLWVKPGAKADPIRSLVTGTITDKTVTWSVQEAGGGTVDQNGIYTAPQQTGTYHVIAASNGKTATTTVTVETTSTWKPILKLFATAEWWMQIENTDPVNYPDINTIDVEVNNIKTRMSPSWGNTYSANTKVAEDTNIRFIVHSRDGRTAKTALIPFKYGLTYEQGQIVVADQ